MSETTVNPKETKKFCVGFDFIKNIKESQYVQAVISQTETKNLCSMGFMKGYFVVYLKDESQANRLAKEGLTIQNQHIDGHVHFEATKIILSGIPPDLSNSLIAENLKNYGNVVYNTLKSIPIKGIPNILSHRRELYMYLNGKPLPYQVTIQNHQISILAPEQMGSSLSDDQVLWLLNDIKANEGSKGKQAIVNKYVSNYSMLKNRLAIFKRQHLNDNPNQSVLKKVDNLIAFINNLAVFY